MDKYEYKLKLEQLNNLVAVGDYMTAAQIADSINWNKVRNASTLCMVGEIYEHMERYDSCKEVLLLAYDYSPIGRNIVCKLTQVAIKAKNVDDAEEYYNEFLEIAPKDNMKYVLAYQISCLKDAPLPDRIAILEELKEKEYTELWAYELAVLYSQADMRDKCVETCDELILWFGDGEYVERALNLKRTFQPLTPAQEEKYQSIRERKGIVEINIPTKGEMKDTVSQEVDVPEVTVTASKFNTLNLQEELAKSMRQIMNATEKETVSDTMESIKKIVSDIPYLSGETDEESTASFNQEQINKEVDQSLRQDFKELLAEESDGQIGFQVPESKEVEAQVEGQMSIEDVLADWEKTKRAAEAAIAAAEQKKLELAKAQALEEAGEIMERLKTLIPILSATPGEDVPHEEEMAASTVAASLIPEESVEKDNLEVTKKLPDVSSLRDATEDDAITENSEEEPVELSLEEEESSDEVMEAVEAADEISSEEENETDKVTEPVELSLEDDEITEGQNVSADEENSVNEVTTVDEETDTDSAEPSETDTYESLELTLDDPEDDTQDEDPEGLELTLDDEEEASEESEEEKPAQTEKASEEDLEKILAQATQMFMENSNVEIPVSGGLPNREFSTDADELPQIQDPEELLTEEKEETKEVQKEELKKGLSEEQKELFSYFLPVPGMEEQITQVLSSAPSRIGKTITSLTGNILIQGEEGSGKTVLATSLIKAIQKEVGNEDAKIGKINAESLNHKDFASLVPKIAGGYLIIENAGELTQKTALRMSHVMEQNTQGMVVVLEDTSAGIRKAMGLDFGFSKKFTEKINIPIFTIDELVDFGKSYAQEMECIIDEMGVLALYNRINNIQKLDHATTLTEVKEIVDEAIESAESSGIKKAFGSIFTKKYDENDYLILREKDFEK